MMVASTMVPSLRISPFLCRFATTASNSALAMPCSRRRLRNLTIVVSSGVTSSKLRPTKRRKLMRSRNCSSNCGSERPNHFCSSTHLIITTSSFQQINSSQSCRKRVVRGPPKSTTAASVNVGDRFLRCIKAASMPSRLLLAPGGRRSKRLFRGPICRAVSYSEEHLVVGDVRDNCDVVRSVNIKRPKRYFVYHRVRVGAVEIRIRRIPGVPRNDPIDGHGPSTAQAQSSHREVFVKRSCAATCWHWIAGHRVATGDD